MCNVISRPAFLVGVLVCLALEFAWADGWAASGSDNEATPKIVVSGTGEVRSTATKASFTVGITTGASAAAAAGGDNARITKAVTDALERANLPKGAIRSSKLRVNPKWQYDEGNRRSRPSGYEAVTTIRIEVADLEHVGAFLDAALAGGATDVSEVTFSIEDEDAPRHQALALAVSHARVDAETLARAAGGSLGELLDLRTDVSDLRPGVRFEEVVVTAARARRGSVDTTIVPDEIRTTATVIAAWRYVPVTAPLAR